MDVFRACKRQVEEEQRKEWFHQGRAYVLVHNAPHELFSKGSLNRVVITIICLHKAGHTHDSPLRFAYTTCAKFLLTNITEFSFVRTDTGKLMVRTIWLLTLLTIFAHMFVTRKTFISTQMIITCFTPMGCMPTQATINTARIHYLYTWPTLGLVTCLTCS